MLIAIFSDPGKPGKITDLGALKTQAGLSDEDFEALLQYSAQVSSAVLVRLIITDLFLL